jgi:hypothetical protein
MKDEVEEAEVMLHGTAAHQSGNRKASAYISNLMTNLTFTRVSLKCRAREFFPFFIVFIITY